jgi:hypothetical protein
MKEKERYFTADIKTASQSGTHRHHSGGKIGRMHFHQLHKRQCIFDPEIGALQPAAILDYCAAAEMPPDIAH